MLGEKLRKVNESGRYPDIRHLNRLLQSFWILKVMEKEFRKDRLTANEISDLLFEGFKIHIKPITIIRSFNRAGNKIRSIREYELVYYQITSEGEGTLYGSVAPPSAASQELFKAIRGLGRKFENDHRELCICYGNSCGNVTAFLLRKISEKTLFHVFAKHENIDKLKDKQGNFLGLQGMLKVASEEKIDGVPCLTPKTCKKVQGIKFLGDVAAHNFLVDIDIEEIREQLPYILVAIKELSSHL